VSGRDGDRPAPRIRRATGDGAELHLLAVAPRARGRGVARALVAACEERASALGCSAVVLSTQPTMRAAHRLYEALGDRRDPSRDWSRPATGTTYLVYEKRL
jgi:ribosomal protein S18 acetylase RimI-like enzyme